MPQFGVHAFTWDGEWNNAVAEDVIRRTAEAGFDLLEIPLLRPTEFDAPKIKQLLARHHLRGVVSLALPKSAHLPFYPERALEFLKLAVDQSAAIESDTLTGCLYCNLGTLTGQPPTREERERCANVLGEVAMYAKPRGIQLGIEPVNRYESYLYNVGSDVIDLIRTIGTGNLFVHFDTYHMNIEEPFGPAIRQAGAQLRYIHLSESDRGIPGQGNVNWDAVFEGLKAIDYRGPLVLEAFATINPDLAGATCMWRKRPYGAQELVSEGLKFVREGAARVGLG